MIFMYNYDFTNLFSALSSARPLLRFLDPWKGRCYEDQIWFVLSLQKAEKWQSWRNCVLEGQFIMVSGRDEESWV
jgi:hypothetical protein